MNGCLVIRELRMRGMSAPEEGDMIDGWYTVRGAARRLQVSEETVRRYIREKKLKAAKIKLVGVKKVWGIDPKVLETFAKFES
jgi:excisionase family DNA binding protein